MPPKLPQYGSPLLALLRGGKEVLTPKQPVQPAVQFGVPKVSPLAVVANGKQALTANTTPQQIARPTGGKLVLPSVAREIVQGTARGAAASGTYVAARTMGATPEQANQIEFTPDNLAKKLIFGDQPFSVKTEAIDPLKQMGASERAAEKYGAPLLLLLTAADALTGGGKGQLLKDSLVAANDINTARRILRTAGVTDEAISTFALDNAVIGIKSTDEAEEFVTRITKAADSAKKGGIVDSVKSYIDETKQMLKDPAMSQGGYVGGKPKEYPKPIVPQGRELRRDALNSREIKIVEDFIDFQRGRNLTKDFEPVVLREQATAIANKFGFTEKGAPLADKFDEMLMEKAPNIPGAMDIKRVETPKVETPKTPAEAKAEWDAVQPPKKGFIQSAVDNLKNPAMRQGGYAGGVPEEIKKLSKVDSQDVSSAKNSMDELRLQRDFLEESIESNPAKRLMKYLGRGDNTLAELQVRAEKTGGKSRRLDDIVTELGYKDLDDAQQALDAYQVERSRLSELNEQIKKARSTVKEAKLNEKSYNDFIRQTAKEWEAEMSEIGLTPEKAKRQYPEIKKGFRPKGIPLPNKGDVPAYQRAFDGMFNRNWTALREVVQDSWVRAKKLQRQPGVVVVPDANPYLAETLFHGRVHVRLEAVKEVVTKIDKDILTTAKKLNVPDKEFSQTVNKYLQALHAGERNAKLGDGAAGITTKQAEDFLTTVDNSPIGKEVKRIADELLDLNRQVLSTLRDSQVISDDVYKTLTETYKNHVPLNRVMDTTEDIGQALTGSGFSVKGTGIKRAVGSEREVADIITNITTNVEQAIIRAEKNLVDLNTLRFARNNKELGLFEEIRPKALGLDFGGNPIMQRVDDPTVLTLREKGKPVYLKINDPHLATMYQNVHMEHVPSMMQWIATFTRLYSSLHTRFNYEFAFSNKFRDIQEMVVDMASRKEMGFKQAGGALAREPKSIKAVTDFIRGADTEGARLYKQMQLDGGTTGGLSLSTRQQVEVDIEQIRKLNRSNPRKAARMLLEAVDNWNTIFEDSTRLSVYREALSRGTDRQTAAMLAKESTVNFNKKGTGGSIINSLYMFSNASIQGTTKMLRAMKNPKVAGAVVSSMGLAVYNLNQYNDTVDPDWRDKVTEFDRTSNFVVLLPSDDGTFQYVTIPVSWGLKPIKVSAEHASDFITGHNESIGDAAKGIMVSAATSYNPLAGNESVVETLTPTFLKTPQEIRSNVAWHGGKIRPDYDPNKPDSAQYFSSLENKATGRAAIAATEQLSEAGIEISPANVNYAFEAYIGGLGRSVTKILNTITSIGKGEQLEVKEIPIASRFFKQPDVEQTEAQRAYKELEEQKKETSLRTVQADKLFKELKKLPPEEANAQLIEIAKADKKMAELIRDRAKKDKWTSSEKAIAQLGVTNGRRAQYVYTKAKTMTPQEANQYIKELYDKGVISKNVVDQIKELKANDSGIIE